MRLLRAIYRFYQTLMTSECEHRHVTHEKSGSYCPDCGYKVQVMWSMVRCRTCTTKRLPVRDLAGQIKPAYKYCMQCGSTEYQIVKKPKINAHDMIYALVSKDVDYTSETVRKPERPQHNPFEITNTPPPGYELFEGEVLKRHVLN